MTSKVEMKRRRTESGTCRRGELTEDVELKELSRIVERIEGSLQRGDTPEGLSRQVEELDVGHKHLQGVTHDHIEDFQAAVEALKQEIEAKLNLTMRAPAGPELGKKKTRAEGL